MKHIVIVLLLAFPILLSAQSIEELNDNIDAAMISGDYPKALSYVNGVLEWTQDSIGMDTLYADYLGVKGLICRKMGRYKEAEDSYVEACQLQKRFYGTKDISYIIVTTNLAVLYEVIGEYRKAEQKFLEVKSSWEQLEGAYSENYAQVTNDLAKLYQNMGQRDLAISLYLEVKEIRKKIFGKDHPEYGVTLNNLAIAYQGIGDTDKAEKNLLEVQRIWGKSLGKEHSYYAICLHNLAHFYRESGKLEKAIQFQKDALKLYKKQLGEDSPDYASLINGLAVIYGEMKDYSRAKQAAKTALKTQQKIFGDKHPKTAVTYSNLANFCYAEQSYDSSLVYSFKSLISNLVFKNDQQINNFNFDQFNYHSSITAFKAINHLISCWQIRYEKSKSPADLDTLYRTIETALRFNEKLIAHYVEEGDQHSLLNEHHRTILNGIETALAYTKPAFNQKAFQLAEQGKALLLRQASRTESAYHYGSLPKEVFEQEKALKKQQTELKASLLKEEVPQTVKDSLRKALNSLNTQMDQFVQQLHKDHPKYAALKYNQPQLKTAEIQQQLSAQTALLSYTIGDNNSYIFYLDKEQFFVFPIAIDKDTLNSRSELLHQSLRNYELLQNDPEKSKSNYIKHAHWFYQQLLEQPLSEAKDIKHLIIIPDGALSQLPFEAFLCQAAGTKERFSALDYVVKHYQISYSYSTALWLENQQTKVSSNNGLFYAFAADYKINSDSTNHLRTSLQPLPAAKKELEAIEQSFEGAFHYGSTATEGQYKAEASSYAIIHLAMHGLLNSNHPLLSMLAFTHSSDSLEDDYLHAYEISKMELQADLVVLSACETGYGKFQQGEGVMSLARSFMYAGVPALVVSLWQVNDQSTSLIMQKFYANLAKGMNKAQALQQAKLDYIASVDNDLAAHPAFWAPFIQLGDSRPVKLVQKGGTSWIWWTIGVAGILLLTLGLGLSRKKAG